ncbi:hypothetical protein ACNH6B_05020 [Shewanella basaltis]|uniref:hypothetical protein n=1 Tax=Shewanella basaltis TaxID=472183 RepID=UPI003AAD2E46
MMSLAIKQPLPQIDNRITPAANEPHGDVGRAAIAAMREMLGKTSAASLFDKLTAQQRALVFFAARLKPSEYLNRPLLSLSTNEREAVRQSLIALVDLGKAFNNMPLSRAQFISPKQTAVSAPVSCQPNNEQVVNDELNRLAKQASELMSEFNHDNKH